MSITAPNKNYKETAEQTFESEDKGSQFVSSSSCLRNEGLLSRGRILFSPNHSICTFFPRPTKRDYRNTLFAVGFGRIVCWNFNDTRKRDPISSLERTLLLPCLLETTTFVLYFYTIYLLTMFFAIFVISLPSSFFFKEKIQILTINLNIKKENTEHQITKNVSNLRWNLR